MVSSEVFTTYMICTTISIISLGIMCIKNIKRDIELLELIKKESDFHCDTELKILKNMLEDIENEK